MPEYRHPLFDNPSDLQDAVLSAGFEATDPIKIIRDLLKAYTKLERDFANYKAMYGPATPKWVSTRTRRKLRK